MSKEFTHIDKDQPSMVDIGNKNETKRTAIAGVLSNCGMTWPNTFQDGEIKTLKGPVFQTAMIAGIQAAKKRHGN